MSPAETAEALSNNARMALLDYCYAFGTPTGRFLAGSPKDDDFDRACWELLAHICIPNMWEPSPTHFGRRVAEVIWPYRITLWDEVKVRCPCCAQMTTKADLHNKGLPAAVTAQESKDDGK